MFPVLPLWGGQFVRTYNLFLILAFLTGVFIWLQEAKKCHIPKKIILEASFLSIPALLLGGKLLFFLSSSSFQNFGQFFNQGGLVFYGSFFAEIIFLFIFFKWRKINLYQGLNSLVAALALAQVVGRLGCLANGCCHGRLCQLPWAIEFSDPLSSAPVNTPLHPTQIYEILGLLIIFYVLKFQSSRLKTQGISPLSFYLLSYSLFRFFIEFYRGDEIRGFWGPLSTSQWISLFLLLIAILLLKKEVFKNRH